MGPWGLGRYNLGTRDPFLEYEGGTLNCEIRTPQHPLKFAPNVSVIKIRPPFITKNMTPQKL